MFLRALQPIASPYGTVATGEGLEVPDEVAAIWIEAGAAELLTAEPEPVVDIAAELAALRARMAELEEARAAQAQAEPGESPASVEVENASPESPTTDPPPDPEATAPTPKTAKK